VQPAVNTGKFREEYLTLGKTASMKQSRNLSPLLQLNKVWPGLHWEGFL